MWLLESNELLADRRLWLRPGKNYLFGRTPAEAGEIVIRHATISRKHLTITVDNVTEGASRSALTRTGVVIEDLATKMGTVVNGQMIKGSRYSVTGDEVEITMAKCLEVFRLKWSPIVFTFTFSTKELQAQPMEYLRERFEQLDIKLLLHYDTQQTSHVISKKRNTAKGLQALVNGRFIVTESFLDAVSDVAELDENDPSGSSLLEQDFDRYWPNAMEHLPPRGNEPVQHPDDIYTPDPERGTVFEGYTFIFYDQTQYQNLLAPITNGCGKALLRAVEANVTTVDDFVSYVKQVAGDKGLGSFDDGSEGRGVVLVRFLPAKGDLVSWYTEFLTSVSLRLDHRPIEQNEFLEAILIKDASRLRRPLEVESSMGDSIPRPREHTLPEPAYPSNSNADSQPALPIEEPLPEPQKAPAVRRVGLRKPVVRRFTGFYHNDADDIDMNDIPLAAPAAQPAPSQPAPSQPDPPSHDEGGLFVPQDLDAPAEDSASRARSQRKRTAEPIPEDDLMEGIAPAVAKFKRQKLHEAFAPPSPEPEPEQEQGQESAQRAAGKRKKRGKAKEELDILAVAAKNREEAEARARAEQEDLAFLPEGIDLAEIRRLNIVEEMEVRAPGGAAARTREEDVGSGRWDPKWNGVKNFKKFRRRGEPAGRQPAREIITLTEVKNKEFGVGDNYWLEDREALRARRAQERAARRAKTPQPAVQEAPRRSSRAASASNDVADEGLDFIDDADDDGGDDGNNRDESSRRAIRRNGRGGSQANSAKRAATPSAGREGPAAKKPRPALRLEGSDEDDSDDELKFRFGKRR